jgi:hypothetical protein
MRAMCPARTRLIKHRSKAAFRGGLAASVALSGIVCGADEKRPCFAWGLGVTRHPRMGAVKEL